MLDDGWVGGNGDLDSIRADGPLSGGQQELGEQSHAAEEGVVGLLLDGES